MNKTIVEDVLHTTVRLGELYGEEDVDSPVARLVDLARLRRLGAVPVIGDQGGVVTVGCPARNVRRTRS